MGVESYSFGGSSRVGGTVGGCVQSYGGWWGYVSVGGCVVCCFEAVVVGCW